MTGVGLIGCGALGSMIADRLCAGGVPEARLCAIAVRRPTPEVIARARQWNCSLCEDALDLIAAGADIVIEAASIVAARSCAIPLVNAGADLMLMSTGALADDSFACSLRRAAAASGHRVLLPSGAIAGLDGILSAAESGPVAVRLTTRKNPAAFKGAPWIESHAIDLMSMPEARVLFEGRAKEAIAAFPANANVAVTLAWALGDSQQLTVRIIADPATALTIHTIEAESAVATMRVELANRPSTLNAGSSSLAALSALASLRKMLSPVRIA